MNNEEVEINDYILKLSDNVDEIEDLEEVLNNLSTMGDINKFRQFLLFSMPFALPYSHNIYISKDGLVYMDVFEKDNLALESPLNFEIGYIKDF
ncbi:hypothetical protein [Methanoplanus endosymbiosus]|uniref:Uncharacterized protein n=1 Tax=Methanoplanus endosymbiosus TaxID=33865 RepID=A0A9E7PMX9_9EURY|nr:hypothetical protein [Methanoplanus endosymbiosus]UUX93215.1 hypothetical protein L6E24_03575 [Methanoplanus endosymbiosus]